MSRQTIALISLGATRLCIHSRALPETPLLDNAAKSLLYGIRLNAREKSKEITSIDSRLFAASVRCLFVINKFLIVDRLLMNPCWALFMALCSLTSDNSWFFTIRSRVLPIVEQRLIGLYDDALSFGPFHL